MRRIGWISAAAVLGLAACGSSGPVENVTNSPTVPITATASTLVATTVPATTGPTATTTPGTSAATVPPTPVLTVPVLTAGGPPPVLTAPPPPPTTKPKATTTTTLKTVAATTEPATTSTTTFVNYKSVAPPTLPKDHTGDVPAAGELPNGVYWGDYSGGEKDTPNVEVRQAYFGDACAAKAAETEDTCDDDLYIPDTPDRQMTLTFASNVKLTVSDATSQKSYQISPDELVRIRASSPSEGAPAGFSFTQFAFLVTVSNGKVTKFEQVWTP